MDTSERLHEAQYSASPLAKSPEEIAVAQERKISLHSHLEGCTSQATLRDLARRNELVDPEDLSPALLADRVRTGGWPAFYQAYLEIASYFCKPVDFFLAITAYAKQLALDSNSLEHEIMKWKRSSWAIDLVLSRTGCEERDQAAA